MNVKVKYRLSEVGQKMLILSGGNGQAVQEIDVPRESTEFARALMPATILSGGLAVLDLTGHDGKSEPPKRAWDCVPGVGEILDDLDARRAAKIAGDEAERIERIDSALEVLHSRKTRAAWINSGDPLVGSFAGVAADWPHGTPKYIKESPEAVAWQADIDAENERRRLAAIEAARIKQATAEAKKAEEARAEAERRALLGIGDGEIDLAIQDHALAEVPIWESHKRGKNWMARIDANAKAPGGLDREFAEKARGDLYYILPSLVPGNAVEFGSDYYTCGGRKTFLRWYGYVVRVRPEDGNSPELLILKKCKDGKSAINEGRAYAASLATTAVATA